MRPARFLACLAFLLALPSLVSAEFTPTIYSAIQTATPPVIDGLLDEPAWNQTQTIDRFYAYQSGGLPAAANAAARFLWDSQFLYAGFEMTDQDIRSACFLANRCGDDAALFNGDVIELFLKELPGRTKYFEFEWSPLGEIFDARFNNTQDPRWNTPPGVTWDAPITARARVVGSVDNPAGPDERWFVETAIPLANLETAPIGVGSQFYFTVARYDYYNNPPAATPALMMSTPGDPTAPNGGVTFGFHSYEIYDILRFTTVPEPAGIWAVLCGLGVSRRVIRRRRPSGDDGFGPFDVGRGR